MVRFETERLFILQEYPGKEVYVQTMAFSSRYPGGMLEFAIGDEVGYQAVDIAALQRQNLVERLAQQITDDLENPIFGKQSNEMPYSVNDFVDLLSRPDAIVLLAWDRHDKTGVFRLVGYLIAERYNRGEIPDDDRTTDNGFVAPPPQEGDLIFDTFAVLRQGQKIGTTLIDLMLTRAIADSNYETDTLYTFAVDPKSVRTKALTEGAYPYTRDMIQKHPSLSFEWEHLIPDYRGASAYYMQARIVDKNANIQQEESHQ